MSTDVWVFTQEQSKNTKEQTVITQTCIYCEPNYELAERLMNENDYEKNLEVTVRDFLGTVRKMVDEDEMKKSDLVELSQELEGFNEEDWLKIEISY